MHAFDIMAEAKMRQWEKDREQGGTSTSPKRQMSLGSGESLERKLFSDIKRLIERSFGEEAGVREQTLREAEEIQVQLSARLERSGCHLLTRYLAEDIGKMRAGGAG